MSIAFNPGRFWESLEQMERIGATPEGGVRRLALSAEDAQARALLRDWCAAGLAAMGAAVIEQAGGLA